MSQSLTDEEKLTLKTGAFGAVLVVSNADPGMFSLFREGFAASGVIVASGGLVRDALLSGPLPRVPQGSPEQIEQLVSSALRQAVAILRAKVPQEVAAYRSVVLDAAERAARAHQGVAPAERATIDRLRAVLDEADRADGGVV